jgi:hypothetical protein
MNSFRKLLFVTARGTFVTSVVAQTASQKSFYDSAVVLVGDGGGDRLAPLTGYMPRTRSGHVASESGELVHVIAVNAM